MGNAGDRWVEDMNSRKDDMSDDFKIWKECESEFKGDLRLYWAGKMAIVSERLSVTQSKKLSSFIELLDLCTVEYNQLIFGGYEFYQESKSSK